MALASPKWIGRLKAHKFIVCAMFAWAISLIAGGNVLLQYANTPSRLATPSQEWPGGATIRQTPNRATLVLFVHPQSPCSRSTVGELPLIMAHFQGKLDAYIYFYAPESRDTSWVRTALWKDSTEIPGVRAMEDVDGHESRRFGAATSGQTLFYNSLGQLVFNGGITASRGHSGSNDGRDAVESLLQFGTSQRHTSPVFGCSLLGRE